MASSPQASERFGAFEFSARADGRVVEETRLRPKPAALLALLLDHRGELTPREVIRERLWPDVVVDFDANLHHCVRQLRSALGESAKNARYLETVPRRGYRLVAGREVDEPTVAIAPRRRWLGWGIAVGMAGAVGAVGLWHRRTTPLRLAILPFDTPTMHAADARDAARLAEHLLADLTSANAATCWVLGVPGRCATMATTYAACRESSMRRTSSTSDPSRHRRARSSCSS